MRELSAFMQYQVNGKLRIRKELKIFKIKLKKNHISKILKMCNGYSLAMMLYRQGNRNQQNNLEENIKIEKRLM